LRTDLVTLGIEGEINTVTDIAVTLVAELRTGKI
jgi:hypothetical protein